MSTHPSTHHAVPAASVSEANAVELAAVRDLLRNASTRRGRRGKFSIVGPGGETLPDFQARVRAAAAEITEPVIWITHAGVIRTLRVLQRGSTWPEAMREAVAYLEPEPFGATRPTG